MTPPAFRRFVAIGDSTTEGLDDPYPGHALGDEVFRGWADRLADRLAASNPTFEYANLAIRGRLIGGIHEEQLEPALAMRPDLASVVGGVNDVLRPKVDPDVVAGHMEAMQSALVKTGATVITMTLPDLSSSMRVARLVSERLAIYNQNMREVAARTGAVMVDLAKELAVYDPRGWSPDRLHANGTGHQMIMLASADAIGDPSARAELDELKSGAPEVPKLAPLASVRAEAAWVWMHLRPWIVRRATGKSSGDGISAKRPVMRPLLEQDLASSQG
jgi:lysophospholipase L1-like esterase